MYILLQHTGVEKKCILRSTKIPGEAQVCVRNLLSSWYTGQVSSHVAITLYYCPVQRLPDYCHSAGGRKSVSRDIQAYCLAST